MENAKEIIYRQSINGKVYKCSKCGDIHFDFKNLSFSFSKEEFLQFKNYFLNLNEHYWASLNDSMNSTKKIRIPIHHKNLLLSFSTDEIIEIKELFAFNSMQDFTLPFVKNRTVISNLCYN